MSQLPKSGPGNLGLKFSPAAFLLGLLAASVQILLLREFAAHFSGSELAFGFVLAGWLLWGAAGSAWAAKRGFGRRTVPGLLRAVPILAGIVFAALRLSRFVLGTLPGELTGIATAALFAFGLTAFLNVPLGAAFVLAARREASVSRVYLWESAGAAAGGLLASLAFVPLLSNWQALAVLGIFTAAALAFIFPKERNLAAALVVVAAMAAIALLDGPSQRLYWKPFELVRSRDGLYGRLSVLRTAEEISLYADGLRLYSCPDRAGAEEAIHFALLQRPLAGRVLLIGGGVGGGLSEILKYPRTEVDYVELDPEIIRLSEEFLPADERRALHDPRVRTHLADGRTYLEESGARYDAILIDLPEPATAQINRFYTLEFFRAAAARLAPGGVFSFRVPSAENYIGPDLQRFLATMNATLRAVFPETAVVPGDSNIFLASDRPLSLDVGTLSGRIAEAGLALTYAAPAQIAARLHPLRVEALRKRIDEGRPALNTDLHPVSYFFHAVLWSTQFKGLEARALKALAGIPAGRLLNIPLILAVLALGILALFSRPAAWTVIPVALMGLTTMAAEILVLIRFQTLHGVVYGRLALLLTAFMAGLAAGAFRGTSRVRRRPADVILIQAGLLGLVLALELLLSGRPPGAVFYGALFVLGFLGGDFFIVAGTVFPERKNRTGIAYAADLAGSFAAAVALSAVLIPLAGLPALFHALAVLNSFGLLFLVVGPKRL